MTDNKSVIDSPIVGDDRVADIFAEILRDAMLAGWNDLKLQERSGVNKHTVAAYRTKARKPSLSNALALVGVIGDHAVNRLFHVIGYQGRPLDESDELQPTQIVAEAMGHLGVIARAAVDNRIDHIERPGTMEAADQLIATVVPLSSAGRRA